MPGRDRLNWTSSNGAPSTSYTRTARRSRVNRVAPARFRGPHDQRVVDRAACQAAAHRCLNESAVVGRSQAEWRRREPQLQKRRGSGGRRPVQGRKPRQYRVTLQEHVRRQPGLPIEGRQTRSASIVPCGEGANHDARVDRQHNRRTLWRVARTRSSVNGGNSRSGTETTRPFRFLSRLRVAAGSISMTPSRSRISIGRPPGQPESIAHCLRDDNPSGRIDGDLHGTRIPSGPDVESPAAHAPGASESRGLASSAALGGRRGGGHRPRARPPHDHRRPVVLLHRPDGDLLIPVLAGLYLRRVGMPEILGSIAAGASVVIVPQVASAGRGSARSRRR